MSGKKFLLVVQGEGRGHMTQAISMYEMLLEQGHSVCAVIVGASSRREIPVFFHAKIKAPIVQLQSPNFVTDGKNKSINITKTVIVNLAKLKTFRASLNIIDELIREHQPDIVINFFDILIGLYYRFYNPVPRLVCIAHQYIYFHPDFEFPKGHRLDNLSIKYYTRLTTVPSSKKLALSFYDMPTQYEGLIVVPPLLRKEVFDLPIKKEDFYLVYLLNSGYFDEIIQWHITHPDVLIHCFSDQAERLNNSHQFDREKLQVHALNDKLFLELMSRAKGLASTAGFESVCEAMYLGKPVLMVPVEGHYEQYCNSRDAYKAGAGIYSDHFDLSRLIRFSATFDDNKEWYKNWVLNAKQRIYNEILTA